MATKKKARTSGQRLNRDLLERARQQARANEADEFEDDSDEVYEALPEPEAFAAVQRRSASSRSESTAEGAARRASTAKRLREKNVEQRKKGLTGDEISAILANPTKIVPESQLRAEYGFVLKDLRSMAVLAAGSFLFLVVLAVLLPQ